MFNNHKIFFFPFEQSDISKYPVLFRFGRVSNSEHRNAHQCAPKINTIVAPVLSHRENAIYIYSIAWDLRLFQLAERLGEMFFHGASATPRCIVCVVCRAG